MGLLSGFRKNKIAKILKSIIEENKKVLDLGCADGTILRALNVEGTGIDINPDTFPLDDNKNKYIQHDFTETLPFESDTFDYCIMSQVIEHFSPLIIKNTLKECFRVLKPNGKIVILTPTPSSDFIIRLLAYLKFVGKFEHTIYFTLNGLEKLCTDIGFRTKDKRYYNLWLDIIYVGEKM